MSALISALTSDAITQLGAAMILGGAIVGATILRGPVVREVPAAGPTVDTPAPPLTVDPDPTPTYDEHVSSALALAGPDPRPLPDDGEPVIGEVIARVVDQLASAIAASRGGLDVETVTRLRDRAYLDLYNSLTHVETCRALVAALHEEAEERARVLVNQFRTLPTYLPTEES